MRFSNSDLPLSMLSATYMIHFNLIGLTSKLLKGRFPKAIHKEVFYIYKINNDIYFLWFFISSDWQDYVDQQ